MKNIKKNMGMSYFGDVSIQISKKRINSHNEGTDKLFSYLANALCGQLEQYPPSYIDITDANDTNPHSYLTQPVQYSSRQLIQETVDNKTIPKASFRFVLPFSQLNGSASSASGNIKIRLYNFNKIEYARASIPIEVVKIEQGQQAVIEWKLYVQDRPSDN